MSVAVQQQSILPVECTKGGAHTLDGDVLAECLRLQAGRKEVDDLSWARSEGLYGDLLRGRLADGVEGLVNRVACRLSDYHGCLRVVVLQTDY